MVINHERYQMIERALTRRPETATADAIVLWQRLGVELSAIIGINGFNSLYARNIHSVRAHYPWLAAGDDPCFERLKASMESQEPALARAAGITLLNHFTDTLIQLIGEPLTTAILQSAWNENATGTAAKGINNEQ